MANAAERQGSGFPGRTANDSRMFGSLREIRAVCQYLQSLMADALKEASVMEANARVAYVSGAINAALLNRANEKIVAQLEAIKQLFAVDVAEFEWCSDDVAVIGLRWSRVRELWPAADQTFEKIERGLKHIDGELDQITYRCASLTFSARVNDIMVNLRIGQPLDVEFEFGAEFPKDAELRKRMLQELAQESAVLSSAVVDVEQGLIYKVAPTRRQQLWSAWRLLAILLAGFLIPIALAYGGRFLNGWPLKQTDLERLLVDLALILVGSGAHLAVEALKTSKAQTRPSFQALNDWVLWLHVRESQIRKGIFYVWLGYVLLVFGVPKLDWASAFFAGYSIDSITELFLGRFQTIVKSKTDILTAAAK